MALVFLVVSMLLTPSSSIPVHHHSHHRLQPQCGYCPTPRAKPPVPFPPTVPVPTIPLPPYVPGVPPPPTTPGVPLPPKVPKTPKVPLPPSLVPPSVPGVPIPPMVPGVPAPRLPPKGRICPPPAWAGGACPINTVRFGGCVDLLGALVHGIMGSPTVHECCPVMSGLAEIEAATCLCTTLKMKAMNMNVYLPLALQLLISCGKTPPHGFTCSCEKR